MMSTKDLNLYRAAEHVKVTDTYKEYLNRPVVSGFNADMGSTHILIECDGTVFVNRSMDLPIDLSAIEDKASQVREAARVQGCKLSGLTKSMKEARGSYEEYYGEVVKAMDAFRQLCDGWVGYKIHEGYGDDTYYTDYLEPLEFKLQRMHFMNTLLMKYLNFSRALDECLASLNDSSQHYTKMTISF